MKNIRPFLWKEKMNHLSFLSSFSNHHHSLSHHYFFIYSNLCLTTSEPKLKRVLKMIAMRGRLLRKIKSISTITALKQGLVFQVSSPNQCFETQAFNKNSSPLNLKVLEPTILVNEVECEKDELFFEAEDHTTPHETSRDSSPSNAIYKISCPTHTRVDTALSEDSTIILEKEKPPSPSLFDFEEKCPPGVSESVVLYTTIMRGIRKTFEDCSKIRFLLENTKIVFSERDVCMDMGFREELWRVVGERVEPPRLFIRGRDIGGTEEVVRLHEQGKLRALLEGIPINPSMGKCSGCGGVGFVLCVKCDGSRKVKNNNGEEEGCGDAIISVSCVECNENGLVKCHVCC